MDGSPQFADWGFVEELKKPRETHVFRGGDYERGEMELRLDFPDPEALLETAYAALRRLGVARFRVEVKRIPTERFEDYELETAPGRATIAAGDTEGVRRGVYHLMELLAEAPSPTELAARTIKRSSWLKTRISRGFYSPIKRPPLNRDELGEDMDCYPDNYLDRLASEGVNGLWLSVSFKDLCWTRFTPEYGQDATARFARLQRIVDKCRRYGIKIFVFGNEPESWSFDDKTLEEFPKLAGPSIAGRKCFCPLSDEGKECLHDFMAALFSGVKHLGGMVNINVGEGLTLCLGAVSDSAPDLIPCPRRCGASFAQILAGAQEAMAGGMRAAAPDALFISWLYIPAARKLPEWIYDAVEQAPDGAVTQLNFESGVEVEQLGKTRCGGDYWLAVSSPSENFVRFAEAAAKRGKAIAAKIQVGCSHEVATVPFVPVPALLYRKYRAMRSLGVAHVMQCWFFGNYPGLMNRAAGRLAFSDFSESEAEFLRGLAASQWGEHAERVAAAWQLLSRAYENYPVSNMFQYFGPVADGVTWPLHLYQADRMLRPTWLDNQDSSGDNICECLENHTLDEAVELLGELESLWSQGAELFRSLRDKVGDDRERQLDIGLVEALGIQFSSAANILRFYQLRRGLFKNPELPALARMRRLVETEMDNRRRLVALAREDSRLGFHSEAETYKYHPEKINRSIALLEGLLRDDFPRAEREIQNHAFVGKAAGRESYRVGTDGLVECETFSWSAEFKDNVLGFSIRLGGEDPVLDELFLGLDDSGLSFPCLAHVASSGMKYVVPRGADCDVSSTPDGWKVVLRIPEGSLPGAGRNGLRLNIVRLRGSYANRLSWPRDNQRETARLNLVFYDPANMGELVVKQLR